MSIWLITAILFKCNGLFFFFLVAIYYLIQQWNITVLMATIPEPLIWEIVKKNNAFLVKQYGSGTNKVVFSREPNNLYNLNSYKYSGKKVPMSVCFLFEPHTHICWIVLGAFFLSRRFYIPIEKSQGWQTRRQWAFCLEIRTLMLLLSQLRLRSRISLQTCVTERSWRRSSSRWLKLWRVRYTIEQYLVVFV